MDVAKVRIRWAEKEAAVRELERNGKVDPADLIQAARNPDHPCHGDFTWDIEEAANERWRDQARKIIRTCKFEVITTEITASTVRYVESPTDQGMFASLPKMRGVQNTSSVMAKELGMLHGNASRVYGIALAKQGIIGAELVSLLQSIRDQIGSIKDSV